MELTDAEFPSRGRGRADRRHGREAAGAVAVLGPHGGRRQRAGPQAAAARAELQRRRAAAPHAALHWCAWCVGDKWSPGGNCGVTEHKNRNEQYAVKTETLARAVKSSSLS